MGKSRMVHNPLDCFQAQIALAQTGMPVFMASQGIFRIIQMQSMQLVQAYDPVKLHKNTVQIIYDVVAAVPDMAGVQTYAHLIAADRSQVIAHML